MQTLTLTLSVNGPLQNETKHVLPRNNTFYRAMINLQENKKKIIAHICSKMATIVA